MDLALVTGDQSDNQQYNETLWVRQLIEGGAPLTPNSGIKSDYSECRPENRAELLAREAAGEIPDEPTYMGVQDYDDLGFKAPDYYDPDEPFGDQYGTFPTWPGLMDRAQSLTFTPVGLRRGDTPVPTYLSNGNHDGLVQGNEDAIKAFEDIATGCFKVARSTARRCPSARARPEPALLAGDRLRGPPGRARAALRGPGRAQADLLRRASRTTATASASSTRPSWRHRASPPPTGRAT